MVFSSPLFLFLFLPLCLAFYFALTKPLRNYFLLLISLLFYAWGEGTIVILMVFSIFINYLSGLGISYFSSNKVYQKIILALGVLANLSFLLYYKYFGFIVENLIDLGAEFEHVDIALPIGISFFTFQSISYLADTYRGEVPVQKNPFDLGLYIALFPQLIAGPIVRYNEIVVQISYRFENVPLFISGAIRFIRGLAKKVIVANTAGIIADSAFNSNISELPTIVAWLGVICYALQIYFDFSGYSDMAIGLGRMFGFKFLENFNYPYISQSIQEFWRRWHISLSSWFRDYLYIPLGGNRKGVKRTYINLLIVFFITGLWHGASWNFVIWGLFHGLFLILEKVDLFRLKSLPKLFRHAYVIIVFLIGWVFFRAETLSDSITYLTQMFNFSGGIEYEAIIYLTNFNVLVLLLGIIFCCPLRKLVSKHVKDISRKFSLSPHKNMLRYSFYIALFFLTLIELAQASYNPFIYFRF